MKKKKFKVTFEFLNLETIEVEATNREHALSLAWDKIDPDSYGGAIFNNVKIAKI